MNNITIAGNLTRDIELRQAGDHTVGSFSIADNQGKDKPAIFWNASIWGKRAEALAPYLTKGQTVTVIGSVTEREYTDKEGQKRKAQDVRVSDIALQGGKRDSGVSDGKPQRGKHESMAELAQGFSELDDAIPF
jgi:single-strand DNA-binding protein